MAQHRAPLFIYGMAWVLANSAGVLGCTRGGEGAAGVTAERAAERAGDPLDAEVLGPAPIADTGWPSRTVALGLSSLSAKLSGGQNPLLVVTLEVPAGSHVYWVNPGESGLATQLEVLAPPGFAVGPTLYPGPVRFRSERGAVSYGYTGRTSLFRAFTPPHPWTQRVEFTVNATWLACSEICVQERGSARIALDPSSLDAAVPDAHVARSLALLPLRLSEAELSTVERSAVGFTLRTAPGVELTEFFPLAPFGAEDRDCTSEVVGPNLLRVAFHHAAAPGELRGVAMGRVSGELRYVEVDPR